MASTISDSSASVTQWRAAQTGLTRLLLRDLRGLRRLVNPNRLQVTVPTWIDAVAALVARYSQVSATLAADFYDGERAAAGASGTFTVPLADAPPQEQTSQSLRWATKDVWDRDADVATDAQSEPLDVRIDAAMTRADGAIERLVLNAGRDTVLEAVKRDPQAVAWARGAALGCCSFCALMATRGATYHTADTAGREANARFEGDGEAKFHNWCRCVVIPVYRGQAFELSPHASAWDQLYKDHAQGHPGEQLRLFRRAFLEHQQSLGRPT
ncbi:hypothetical protein OG785_45720 [Streptomyces sp. NBC_00006]|uniref:VG15 protein n=1 Tax=Streptomyces sp. NBC_00006 TaxID=2975619 RepID=UPI0022573BA5|nr:hypothetical protein [Streptomyces sp. NBC_00006]MCX5537729.1 hypothetical protein [Streptomyces sp. NBC_00006]MCX5537860.1 hypothetical protein [Streptomyces sp. NBC_00006]